MPIKSTNTFTEWLQSLMNEISKAKLLPDALPELSWITNLETVVLQKAHESMAQDANPQQVQPTPVSSSPMGMPSGMPMGPEAMGQAPPTQQSVPGGVMPNAPMPSPDELRRVLQLGGQ